MKKFGLFLLFALLMFLVPIQSAQADPLLVHAKFSPGGYSITLWMDEENTRSGTLARTLVIKYCDGTSASRLSWRFIPALGSRGLSHSFKKPVDRVVVFWTGVDEEYSHNSTFRRDCSDPVPTSGLFCNLVSIDQNLHRGETGQVQFVSHQHLRNAWIKLGDNPEFAEIGALIYSSSTRQWSGSFNAAGMLVGKYEDAFLLVQDEFDRQAKCRLGDLTILDWEQ